MTARDDSHLEGEYYRIRLGRERSWLARAKASLDAYFAELVLDPELPLVPLAMDHDEVAGVVAGIDARDKDDSALVRARNRGRPFLVRVSGIDLLPDDDTLELSIVVYRRIRHERVEAILRRVATLLSQAGLVEPAGSAAEAQHPGATVDERPPTFGQRLRRWIRGK